MPIWKIGVYQVNLPAECANMEAGESTIWRLQEKEQNVVKIKTIVNILLRGSEDIKVIYGY